MQINRLCYSDCLLIQNANPKITADSLREVFEKKGYVITSVVKQSSSLMVYFSNYKGTLRHIDNNLLPVSVMICMEL